MWNGNPTVRIWRVGTNRILGVAGQTCANASYPPAVMPGSLWSQLDWDHDFFADLTVCPVTRDREGFMQMVCIDSARNIAKRTR
jgi:hypothetical protein